MRRLLLVLLLGLEACGGTTPTTGAAPADAVVATAERAEAALRTAYAHADAAPLDGLFEGRALTIARRQLAELARRGVHREQVVDARRDVHVSVAGDHAEVVLQVKGRERQVMAGKPPPAYSNFVRQWRATLARRPAGWKVVDDGDLPPPQWWPAS